MNYNKTIAIIGAGASGTITAIYLLRLLQGAKILLFEKTPNAVYRGAAYSSKLIYEPLNVPVGKMSIFNDFPDDFFNWLQVYKQPSNETEITRESFVSRRWFGDYLAHTIKREAQFSKTNTLELLHTQVINIDKGNTAYQLITGNEQNIEADTIVFASGNEAPAEIFNAREKAFLNGNYTSNPWLTNSLDEIKKNARVLIIGTGLTMIDNAISLYKSGHQGKIYAISRHGYLPLVHGEHEQELFEVDAEQGELAELIDGIKNSQPNHADSHNNQPGTIEILREKTPQIWKSLSTESKRVFLSKYRQLWDIHRHRMPGNSGATIREMQSYGVLQILTGTVKSISQNEERILVNYEPSDLIKDETVEVDNIINCTGPSGDYLKTENLLIKNLLAKGWMKQDELKLGIVTADEGKVVTTDNTFLTNVFTIGPLRKATEWETTAIREIRSQAQSIAVNILESQVSHISA